jgi:hypothetical protein
MSWLQRAMNWRRIYSLSLPAGSTRREHSASRNRQSIWTIALSNARSKEINLRATTGVLLIATRIQVLVSTQISAKCRGDSPTFSYFHRTIRVVPCTDNEQWRHSISWWSCRLTLRKLSLQALKLRIFWNQVLLLASKISRRDSFCRLQTAKLVLVKTSNSHSQWVVILKCRSLNNLNWTRSWNQLIYRFWAKTDYIRKHHRQLATCLQANSPEKMLSLN